MNVIIYILAILIGLKLLIKHEKRIVINISKDFVLYIEIRKEFYVMFARGKVVGIIAMIVYLC